MPATKPLTRRQHHQAQRTAYLTKNPNLKPREWDEHYPPGTRDHIWRTNLERALKAGVSVTRHVLDDAFAYNKEFGYHLLGIADRSQPSVLPNKYLPPHVRRAAQAAA